MLILVQRGEQTGVWKLNKKKKIQKKGRTFQNCLKSTAYFWYYHCWVKSLRKKLFWLLWHTMIKLLIILHSIEKEDSLLYLQIKISLQTKHMFSLLCVFLNPRFLKHFQDYLIVPEIHFSYVYLSRINYENYTLESVYCRNMKFHFHSKCLTWRSQGSGYFSWIFFFFSLYIKLVSFISDTFQLLLKQF